MNLELLSLFDYFIIIIICISILISFFKGFIQSFLGLLTWIGAVIITLIFYENLAYFITNYLNRINFLEKSGLSIMIATVLSIPFIFLISLIILKKIRSLLSADFNKSGIGNLFDKILGFIYGFIFGLIIVIITITTINNFTDDFRETAFVKNSLIYPYIQDISNKYINKYSPILIESTEEIIEENID